MKLQPWQFRLMMNAYPPLFLNGIRIVFLSNNYQQMKVKIRKGLINRNLQGSLFGGAIFSAFDPFYPVMLWQILAKSGIQSQAWLRAAEIDYIKPSKTSLLIDFSWSDEEVLNAKNQLLTHGKYKGWHYAEAENEEGVVCVKCKLLVVLKSKDQQNSQPGF